VQNQISLLSRLIQNVIIKSGVEQRIHPRFNTIGQLDRRGNVLLIHDVLQGNRISGELRAIPGALQRK